MDAETRERFEGIDRRLDAMDHRMDERLDEQRRFFGILAEGLRDDLRLVAEGQGILRAEIHAEIAGLRREQQAMVREIVAAVRPASADLDRRVTSLEGRTTNLETRVSRLEGPG